MWQKTIVLLKVPRSHEKREMAERLVLASLKQAGLISAFRYITLTEQDILDIYGHIPPHFLIAQLAICAYQEFGVWEVFGDDAIAKVNRLKGSEVDPYRCTPDSWRYRLSEFIGYRAVKLYGGGGQVIGTMYENYIHSPKPEEVPINLEVLRRHETTTW